MKSLTIDETDGQIIDSSNLNDAIDNYFKNQNDDNK